MKQQVYLLIEHYKGELGLTRRGSRMCLSNDTLYCAELFRKDLTNNVHVHAKGSLQITFSKAWRFSSFTTFNACCSAPGSSSGCSTRLAYAPHACAVNSNFGDGLKSVPGKLRVFCATPSGKSPRAALRLAFQAWLL